ncbi:MAG: MerR family transcriptional regulator [Faecalicoccus sp.]|nr:MerR family transcriptional regulator [Faecalicoccus sp.]
MEDKLYTVSDICYLTGVTRKTLFYYDKIGLLMPSLRQGIQKHKMYDSTQKIRLEEILKYRSAGMTILEVKSLLDDPMVDRKAVFAGALKRLNEEYEQKKEQIEALNELMIKESKD